MKYLIAWLLISFGFLLGYIARVGLERAASDTTGDADA